MEHKYLRELMFRGLWQRRNRSNFAVSLLAVCCNLAVYNERPPKWCGSPEILVTSILLASPCLWN
jgi:hypothetical protein